MWRYHCILFWSYVVALAECTVWINYFCTWCACLFMLNYDKPSCIFSCKLLTRNLMIFLVQFGINKHLLIFSKTTNCPHPMGFCNFVSLKKLLVLIYSKLHWKSFDYLYKKASQKVKTDKILTVGMLFAICICVTWKMHLFSANQKPIIVSCMLLSMQSYKWFEIIIAVWLYTKVLWHEV